MTQSEHLQTVFAAVLLVWCCFLEQAAGALDASLVDLVSRAMELAFQVQTQDVDIIQGDFYIDGPHAAMFAEQDKYCFVAFDSTHPDFADSWVNWDPFNGDICTNYGDCCRTRNGFRRAYEDPYYRDIIEQQVRNCKTTLGKEIVMVGHSQGGGIAPVGAVALADVDPTVIIFGAPGSINDECPPLNLQKYHHFTNTLVTDKGSLRYDHVNNINFRSERYGNLYVMGDDPHNVVHYTHKNYPIYTAFDGRAHQRHRYEHKIATLMDTVDAGTEIGTNGWSIGFPCNKDSECIDKCVDGKCHRGLNGDPCNRNADCDSGRCEGIGTWLVSGTCEAQLPSGQSCNEASDCISNSCSFSFWRKCN